METHKVISRTKDIGSNKSLLDKGLVPGIVYGKGTEPTKIAFKDQDLKIYIDNDYKQYLDCITRELYWK